MSVLGAAWGLIQPPLRFLAWVLVLAAALAAVNDYTRDQQRLAAAPASTVIEHWKAIAPRSLDDTQKSVSTVAPWVWDPVMTAVLSQPAWLVLSALAFLLGWAGRHREPLRLFTN
ncbi:MAG: hypothetical protein ACFCUN_01695 [Hyphomicrobiaceae bacterium]